jgi:hypothetical protein
VSVAVAVRAIVAGLTKPAAAGLVNDTVGAALAVTVIVRAVDVRVAPLLSVATAVSTCVPAGALAHVTAYGLAAADPISAAPA